jgi:hypothetical protein
MSILELRNVTKVYGRDTAEVDAVTDIIPPSSADRSSR